MSTSEHYILTSQYVPSGGEPTLTVLGVFKTQADAASAAKAQARLLLSNEHKGFTTYRLDQQSQVETFGRQSFSQVYEDMANSLEAQIKQLQTEANNARQASGTTSDPAPAPAPAT
jgi:hypothetical protein